MYPHRIRLRGPWECEPLARAIPQADGHIEMVAQDLPPACRMTMPCRWGEGGLVDFAGRARLRRRFGIPRQLDPHERVWLTFAGAEAVARVSLNGRFLGRHDQPASAPFEFEVTELLQERNELVVDVEAPADNGGLWGEVALEVRCRAFLRAVRAWPEFAAGTVRLRVRGEAVGTSERPLELYVLWNRSTIAYGTIQPTAAGQSFDIVSEDIPRDRWDRGSGSGDAPAVQIDLVNGGTIWYRTECLLEWESE
jgi:hypothetical protein